MYTERLIYLDLIVSLDSIMDHKVEDKDVYTFSLIPFLSL